MNLLKRLVFIALLVSGCTENKASERQMTKSEWEAEAKAKKVLRTAAEKEAKADMEKLNGLEAGNTVESMKAITNQLNEIKARLPDNVATNSSGGIATNSLAYSVEKTIARAELMIENLEKERSMENSLTKVRFGYVSFAPYTISKTPASAVDDPIYIMDEGDSAGSAFIEVTFADRLAWRTDTGRQTGFNGGYGKTRAEGADKIRRPWDWEAKLGFILTDNLDSGETSGSSIAAGGDIYAELAAGYPLFYFEQNNGLQISMNIPEVVGTWVTDKSSFDIHDSYKVCVAFVARGNVGTKGRAWKMLARIGPGWVETPSLTGELDNVTGSPIVDTQNGQPKFNTEFGLATQVLFDIPVFEQSTISLSGEFWNVDDVNPWSAFISYSKSFSELGTLLNL